MIIGSGRTCSSGCWLPVFEEALGYMSHMSAPEIYIQRLKYMHSHSDSALRSESSIVQAL